MLRSFVQFAVFLCFPVGLLLVLFGALAQCADSSVGEERPSAPALGKPAGLPAPSSMLLADYEAVLYPWLGRREYVHLGWAHDAGVRDTGPLVNRQYFGTHPAVRIYYSPEVVTWLEDRKGELPDGAMIVKEMYFPPAAFYQEIAADPYFESNPDQREALLEQLLMGWTVMLKDRAGGSKDGWFWATPGAQREQSTAAWLKANVDDNAHVRYAGFGLGTCIRCHASAEKESTFASLNNIGPPFSDQPPIRFHVDNSWRTEDYWAQAGQDAYRTLYRFFEANSVPETTRKSLHAKFNLPKELRPWRPEDLDGFTSFVDKHSSPPQRAGDVASPQPNPAFVKNYPDYATLPATGPNEFTLPMQWGDHVYPGPQSGGGANRRDEYITSNNCLGCHGGLGGAPSGLSMFIKTGRKYGEGYNVSEFGEWRWSPMGLAGRDPIFHAQLESEMILLLENGGKLPGTTPDPLNPLHGSVVENQKALANTCLSCHGAMGQRQLAIDAKAGRKLPSGAPLHGDFNPDYFYLTEALTAAEQRAAEAQEDLTSPPRPQRDVPNPSYGYERKGDFYNYHRYGELARGGISCAVCHHIAAPGSTPAGVKRRDLFLTLARGRGNWLPEATNRLWRDNFIYFLAENTTGQFERGPANELYGPFANVLTKPMQNAMGITPVLAPPMDSELNSVAKPPTPFIADSNMCGTCHTINLPNIGLKADKFPALTEIENNPAFRDYPHSVEQATYLEWLNSDFGPGKYNKRGPDFQSCQDCHMPNRITITGANGRDQTIDPLVSQIASIQDAAYGAADNALPAEEITVPLRSDYRRHELVGLNAFVVAMAQQFPEILGVAVEDYETGAVTGPKLAIDGMLRSAREDRVATLHVGPPRIAEGKLTTQVTVTNQTGHRFPSGVSFRRAFLEFVVLDEKGDTLWASGETNAAGLITDGKNVLATELLETKANPGDAIPAYQPNYQVISDRSQVQIYEELITNANGAFTTSFIHRVDHIKDNRLLPRGWIDAASFSDYDKDTKLAKQGQVLYEFMLATDPEGASVVGGTDPNGKSWEPDPDFTESPSPGADHVTYAVSLKDMSGTPASIRVTLYSQALMPAWLHQRFATAARAKRAGLATPETDRLYYIASRLKLDGKESPELANWKLRVSTTSKAVQR